MKISKLTIKNFRSIEGALDINFSQISALIGQNNVGKTNILLAIKKILWSNWLSVNTFNEDDVFLKDPDRDIEISFELDPAFQYSKFKGGDTTEIKTILFRYTKYKVGSDVGQRRLEKECLDLNGNKVYVLARAPQKGVQHKYEPLIGVPQEILDSLPIIFIGERRELKDQMPNSRYSLLKLLLEDVNTDFQNPDNKMHVRRKSGEEVDMSRNELFKNYITKAMELLRTDEFGLLEKSIKDNALKQLGFDPVVDTDKVDFYFSPFSSLDFYKALKLLVKEGEFEIDATELGGGFQNALVISILKAYEERRKQGAIILIEEPELYLHPQMQRSLYKTLREIGKTNQIIYTTHSPHFVTIPEYDEITIITKDNNRTDKNVSYLKLDEIQREKIRKELDPERNEMFFCKKLLLVEGDTEKLAFPEYAKKLNVDLDNKGITIVEVGGKKNLLEFANIAISFNIPTGIVYDIDSNDFEKEDKEAEKKYNMSLDDLKSEDSVIGVWSFENKYEDELRKFLGEDKYQELCQKYSVKSKPIKQRLIAIDLESKIPNFIESIITKVSQ